MRIAALSDIHSNVFALEAVVADIKKHGVDVTVNLEDIFYGPIAPRATYELLMECDFVTICGNQDRQIYEASHAEIDSNPTMKFVIDDLGHESIEWMKSLPFDRQLSGEIYLCHGSPSSDLDYLLENVESGHACVRDDAEIFDMLNGQSSEMIICGHTHISRTVYLTSGQLIVNPGSVGLPAYTDDEPVVHSMENYCPHASYAILEKSEAGWTVQHIKVPYEFLDAAKKSKERQREDWEYFLITGREL